MDINIINWGHNGQSLADIDATSMCDILTDLGTTTIYGSLVSCPLFENEGHF